MAIKFLDAVSVAGTISSANIKPEENIVQSPKTITGSISGISEILLMDQTTYDNLTPKLSSVLYVIV